MTCRGVRLLFGSLLAGLFLGWLSIPLPAAEQSSFDAANVLYEQGRYASAATMYADLIASGKATTATYFNLGNAWYKAGKLGKAIQAYRKAEQLAPGDPDIRANLTFAREQRKGPSLVPGRLEQGLRNLSLDGWTLLAAAAFWAWAGVLLLLLLRPEWKPTLGKLHWVLLAAVLALGLCLGSVWHETHARQFAVVAVPEISVRHGPLEESQPAFTAYDGAELEVLDRKDHWVQVRAGTQQVGWVPKESLLSVF